MENIANWEVHADETNSPVMLAYVGDAWYNLFCRTYLVERFSAQGKKINDIHNMTKKFVSAVAQAQALKHISTELTEEEQSVVRRGRNTKMSVPKSATVAQYRMSTGFEALFGYLLYKEESKRMVYLAKLSMDFMFNE